MRWFALAVVALLASPMFADDRPNILFIISEDNGPQLGCYGDGYAKTPNIDKFATESLRYIRCWSNAPVCAPARTTLISGMYPTSTGAENMRSLVALPEGMKFFPQYLRDAGYFTTNARKEDFNLKTPGQLWDVPNDANRPWAKRKEGQPFFSTINIPTSHESQLRKRPHELVHDSAKARIPAYHPDTPEVRRDWAQYYDKLTEMDAEVGAILDRLEADGLKESTIVFYFGDHGSGMPRSKRWPFNSGLHVPLIVRIPEAFKTHRPDDYSAGGASDRLVAFVDFAPTVLSLAGIETPEHQQGVAFLGEHAGPANEYLHGFRGRMDERIDLVRSVTDGHYVYVRHYMPHRIFGQHVGYMFETPTTQVWKTMFDAGDLNAAQSTFWKEKPTEELFDLTTDPDEVTNLAGSAMHRETLERFRQAQREQVLRIRDVGLLPEAMMNARCKELGVTPYELARDPNQYRLERVLETAEMASQRDAAFTQELANRLGDENEAVRYWALTGFLVRGESAFPTVRDQARRLLRDESPNVRIAAAELVGRYDNTRAASISVETLLKDADYHNTNEYAPTAALIAIDELLAVRPDVVERHADKIEALPLPGNQEGLVARVKEYPSRLKAMLDEKLAAGRK
ncbi:MAG: sulfatase-like hydrolase/transferase [Planctomycetaceae bacterium]|nr:sulfatase-like hydrolase/transferase [Planctomycetaceae bacterium]